MVIVLSILGYGIGKLLGGFFVSESAPSWHHYVLPPPPKKIINIAYYLPLVTKSEVPTGDIIFVKTENEAYYSYTLFENHWQLVNADPTRWNNLYNSKCATKWNEDNTPYEFADLKSYPPVEKGVVDSMGENWWDYPSTSTARCYTLSEDGSLQVWTYSGNVPELMKNRIQKNILMVAGALVGIIVGIFIVRHKTKKMELVKI